MILVIIVLQVNLLLSNILDRNSRILFEEYLELLSIKRS